MRKKKNHHSPERKRTARKTTEEKKESSSSSLCFSFISCLRCGISSFGKSAFDSDALLSVSGCSKIRLALFFFCTLARDAKSNKKQVFQKTNRKVLTAEKRAERDTTPPLFFPHSSNSSNARVYIYIYIYITHTHTRKFESYNHVFDDNQHLIAFGQTAFLVFLEAPHEATTETTK